jgi:hypothetical protein|tara:strand:+ start:221 stop:523 length:303 start_codon:yes stop_codon:yes gene_type:complete
MKPNYTEAQCEVIRENAPLNFEVATQLGTEFGKKTRSVIAKAISLGVEYNAKPRATKSGEPIVLKSEIVNEIESHLNIKVPTLSKATKEHLTVLRNAICN